jgi:hypothetical protein
VRPFALPPAALTPALLASTGREPNSPSAQTAPGSDTGSRNLPAEAAMLGGGYGSQRQQHKMKHLTGVGCGETIRLIENNTTQSIFGALRMEPEQC